MRYFILFFFILSLPGFSQSISKQMIGFSGTNFDNGSNKLNYSAGEVVVGAMTGEDGAYQLGNGYFPSLKLSTLNIEAPKLKLQIKVFPNPVTETLFINHPTQQYFDVMVTDISGKQILKTAYRNHQPLSLQNLTSGTYFIRVTTKDSKQTNTYKIIKR
jgi:hypothetical protein